MAFVKTEVQGAVEIITIDRPKALNALNPEVLADLKAAFEAVDQETIRCIVLTGEGDKSFVAGADIGSMSTMTKAEGEAFGKLGNDVFLMIEHFPIPVIAAVNGFALGGGNELQILDIIKNLQKKNQTSVIMITHDLGVVANIAQKIAVMYSGIIVESGTCEDIFYRPRHPYTWALIRSVPRLDLKNKQELATIPGTPPDLLNPPVGCPFCTRCSYCMPICKEEMPEATEFGGEHKAACWLHHPMAPKVEMPNLEGGEL